MPLRNVNLPVLIERFHSDSECRKALEEIRWPEGIACLKCGSLNIAPVKDRPTYVCRDCAYQFSVTVGTVLQDSKIPLFKWFLATFMMCESRKGVSSKQLKRMLGLGSYRSAWFLTHRIRFAMGLVDGEQLRGVIEADEAFVGGKPRRGTAEVDMFTGQRRRGPVPGKPKPIVLGALERSGGVRMRVAPNRGKVAIKSFLNEHVADEAAALYTDEWGPYKNIIADDNTIQASVQHSVDEWVRGDVHTNGIESVWSLLKRSIIGSYHQLSVKHLDAYVRELEFRFNNRDNPHLFRDTLRALMSSQSMEYKELVSA